MARKRIHKKVNYLTVTGTSFNIKLDKNPSMKTVNRIEDAVKRLETKEWTPELKAEMVKRFNEVRDQIKPTLKKYKHGGFLFHTPQQEASENALWTPNRERAQFVILCEYLGKTQIVTNDKKTKTLNEYWTPQEFLDKLDEIEASL